jgi:hypothetical protein
MQQSSLRRATTAVTLAVLTASCGGGKKAAPPTTPAVTAVVASTSTKPTTTSTSSSSSTATTVATTTTTVKGEPREPFTGKISSDTAKLDRPALVVKIDNAPERDVEPQIGIEKADMVFEEIVEGVTRFAVVFHSQDAETVGPIRSARTTDVDLLSQLSNPLLAWSGGNGGVVAAVRGSGRLYDIGNESGFDGLYYRERSRVEPHNLFSGTPKLYSAWSFPQAPPKAIFAFRTPASPPVAGDKVEKGVAVNLESTNVVWVWNAIDAQWQRSQYGHAHKDGNGRQHSVENVVILFTNYRQSPADPNSPEAISVGGGEAWVLTDGKLITGKWLRTDPLSGYVLVDEANKVIELRQGRTWVELPRPGGAGLLP